MSKRNYTEVQVAVLNYEDGAESRELVTSVESLGELIEQALKVCREFETFALRAETEIQSPRLKLLFHEINQMREDFRKAGVLVDIGDEEDEGDGEEKTDEVGENEQ